MTPHAVRTSADFLCKEPGLRILDRHERFFDDLEAGSEYDGDDSDESCSSSAALAIEVGAQRPTVAGETPETHAKGSQKHQDAVMIQQRQDDRSDEKRNEVQSAINRKRKHDVQSVFAVSSSLFAFMNLRGYPFKKPCLAFEDGQSNICPASFSHISRSSSQTNDDRFHDETSNAQDMMLLSCELEVPATIFVNATLLQTQQSLISVLIAKESKGLSIIYRDLDPTFDSITDIILSPTACILITNMQSLIQRPLPGQKLMSDTPVSIRKRIADLTLAFDMVFVLVLHQTVLHSDLSASDAHTIEEFETYCTSLSSRFRLPLPSGCSGSSPSYPLPARPPAQAMAGTVVKKASSSFPPSSAISAAATIKHTVHPKYIAYNTVAQRNSRLNSTVWSILASQTLPSDDTTTTTKTVQLEKENETENENNLRSNIPSTLCSHSAVSSNRNSKATEYTQDETDEEINLRRTGLNCMAAQRILLQRQRQRY